MSDNTQDSDGSRRSITGRSSRSSSEAKASFKNSLNRLGESISRGVTHGVESMKDGLGHHDRAASRDSPRYSKGVRELNDQGYEVYNIGDDSEIFISRTPDKALFDDGDPVFVSGDDVFVGKVDEAEPVRDAPVEVPQVNAMSFFANVPRGSSEVEIRGTVGVNNCGHIESAGTPVNVRQEPVVSFEVVEEGAVCDAPAEASVRQASAEAPLQEVPVEAPSNEPEPVKIPDFMNRIRSGARPAPKPAREVSVEAPVEEVVETTPVEVPVEAPVREVPVRIPVEEVVETTPVEVPVEAPVREIPVEAPVEEAVEAVPVEAFVEPMSFESPVKVHEEFFIDAEEAPVEEVPVEAAEEDSDYSWMFEDEESVESPVADDVDVDAVVAQIVAEEVAKQVVVAQIADTMVVKPSMPVSSFMAEELSVTEESSVVDASAIVEPASVSTSAEAEAHVKPTSFDADGEALPPIADPVVKRPRSMRFRFTNGVLMNVDKEPKEELQGPLD